MHNNRGGSGTLDIISHIEEVFFRGKSKITPYQKQRGEITDDMVCFKIPEENIEIWTKYPERGKFLINKYKNRFKYMLNTSKGIQFISKYETQ